MTGQERVMRMSVGDAIRSRICLSLLGRRRNVGGLCGLGVSRKRTG